MRDAYKVICYFNGRPAGVVGICRTKEAAQRVRADTARHRGPSPCVRRIRLTQEDYDRIPEGGLFPRWGHGRKGSSR